MKILKNNSGVTLIETIIYMLLSLILIGYVLNSMSNLSSSYVHQRTVVGLQASGRDALAVMARELSTTGFKHFLDTNLTSTSGNDTVTYRTVEIPGTFTDSSVYRSHNSDFSYTTPASLPADYKASFFAAPSADSLHDTIEIFRAVMGNIGKVAAVERIKYFLTSDSLLNRVIFSLDLTPVNLSGNSDSLIEDWDDAGFDYHHGNWKWENGDTMTILDNVTALQFSYGENYSQANFWHDLADINGRRDDIKFIKITFLARSHRSTDVHINRDFNIGGKIVSSDGLHLYRIYEQTVEVPSNGNTLN